MTEEPVTPSEPVTATSDQHPVSVEEKIRSFLASLGEDVPLQVLQRAAIQYTLRKYNGRVGPAAKALGIGRATLYRRLYEEPLGSCDAPVA